MAFAVSRETLFHPRTGMTASLNRYYIPEAIASDYCVSLVFIHSSSNHKEQWEILMPNIFAGAAHSVNEIWAIDALNHGESAVLNEKSLETTIVGLEEYSDLLAHFIQSTQMKNKKIILVGHSTGTCVCALAVSQLALAITPIVGLILIEPVFVLQPILPKDNRLIRGELNVKGVISRKSVFGSIEEAKSYIERRMPWKTWDKRMIESYLTHGFKQVPDSQQVALRCSLKQEVWNCPPNVPILAGRLYPSLCASFPVHGIFGERPEMYSAKTREAFFNGINGSVMPSVHVVPGTGHLVVQEKPDEVADRIVHILNMLTPPIILLGKL